MWAITCFTVRVGYRRQGISRALVRAAVGFAKGRGARALEGYPMVVPVARDVAWPGELFVGTQNIFTEAGFVEVSKPTKRRVVMRIDF